jgi:hypothetical protein
MTRFRHRWATFRACRVQNELGAKPLLNSPYGAANVRRISFKRLPKAIREAGISKIERQLETGTVTDLVAISEGDWHDARR